MESTVSLVKALLQEAHLGPLLHIRQQRLAHCKQAATLQYGQLTGFFCFSVNASRQTLQLI